MNAPAQVDVLIARVRAEPQAADFALLTAEEAARAARYANAVRRAVFVAGRAFLKRAIAVQMGCSAIDVRLIIAPGGKPMIAPVMGKATPFFSFSHGAGHYALALCASDAVGVDIESLCSVAHPDAIARRFLSLDAAADIAAADDKPRAFLAHWTQLEARLKLTGQGFRGDRSGAAHVPCETIAGTDWIGAVACARPFTVALEDDASPLLR